jgi:hypothetical protein
MKPVVVLALLMLTAETATATEHGWISGAGTLSCGGWIQARHLGEPADMVIVAWTQGYLTAFSLNLEAGGAAPLRYIDQYAVKAWLDKYCAQNPLKRILDAATALASELRGPE